MTDSTATWMWFKPGDHLAEGHRLCQVCAEETRDPRLLETASVRAVRLPEGNMMTFVFADGPWVARADAGSPERLAGCALR